MGDSFQADSFTPDTPSTFKATNEKDAQGNAVVDPNTIGTMVRHWWEGGGNPVQIGQVLPFPKALGGSGMDNPLLPTNIVRQMHAIKQEGDAAWAKGDKVTAAAKYVESIIPILGPWMSNVGNAAQRGKWAAVAGDTAGLATGVLEGRAADAAMAARYPLADHPATTSAMEANRLSREATQQVSQRVLAPGAANYKAQAARIAPEVLRRGLSGDRFDLQDIADSGKAEALARIDAAANLDPSAPVDLKPVVQKINEGIDRLQPTGATPPGAERAVDALRQQRDFILNEAAKQTGMPANLSSQGPLTLPFHQVRGLRQVLDNMASAGQVYSRTDPLHPAAVQASAAADAAGALREAIAQNRPELVGPNADYAFYKALSDVLDPTRGRPKNLTPNQTGVTGGAATQSAVIATALPGPLGKLGAGARMFAAMLREAQSSPAWQLADASRKYQMAEALRAGNIGKAQQILLNIVKVTPKATQTALSGAPLMALQPATATGQ